MEARLASSVLAAALIRRAESEGGFGAVLSKGDATAGAIAVILMERGGGERLFERILQPDGGYRWDEAASGSQAIRELIARRRRFDPDLWVIELNVPSVERFVAGMNEVD